MRQTLSNSFTPWECRTRQLYLISEFKEEIEACESKDEIVVISSESDSEDSIIASENKKDRNNTIDFQLAIILESLPKSQ